MIPLIPRIKLAVAEHGSAVAAVLVVIGVVAFAGAAWTLTHPPEVQVTEQVATQRVGTDVTTSTVVTGNTTLWERGTTLTNKPVYPLKSAPNLTVQVHTSVPSGEEVHVTQELTLVYRATKDGEVFWQADQRLLENEAVVRDGEVTSSATFDVRNVRSHLDAINRDISGIGRAQAYLRLNVSYRTADYSGTISKTAPMAVLSSGYWVGGSLEAENAHEKPVTREVTEPPDHQKAVGLGLLGFLSLGGAGGVAYLSTRRFDPGALEDELSRARYREWVSAGRLGQFVSAQDVSMDSLKDLVDVAIDSNNRVVHDTQRELYAVVDGDVIYYYDPYHDEPDIEFEPNVEVPVRHDGGKTSVFEPEGELPTESDSDGAGVDGDAHEQSEANGDILESDEDAPEPEEIEQSEPDEDFLELDEDATEPEAAEQSEPTGEFLRGAAEANAVPLPVDAVSVSVEVTRKEGLPVISYYLSSDTSAGVTADLVDSRIEPLWAVPGFKPDEANGLEGAVSFRASVPGEGERVVRYVVRTGSAPDDEVEDLIESLSSPRVDRVLTGGDSQPD